MSPYSEINELNIKPSLYVVHEKALSPKCQVAVVWHVQNQYNHDNMVYTKTKGGYMSFDQLFSSSHVSVSLNLSQMCKIYLLYLEIGPLATGQTRTKITLV